MSDMLRLAEGDMRAAELLLNDAPNADEVLLNYAGYHCSQAAEKLLKYYIITKGYIPPKTHSANELLNYMENRNIQNNIFKGLETETAKFDSWSSNTRYAINSLATIKQITQAISILKELLYRFRTDESRTDSAPEEDIKSELSLDNLMRSDNN